MSNHLRGNLGREGRVELHNIVSSLMHLILNLDVHVLVVTHSLSDEDHDGRRPYCKLVAGVLRDMGVVKCQLGEMAAGCQLLHESAGLYQWMPRDEKVDPSVQDVINTAEV